MERKRFFSNWYIVMLSLLGLQGAYAAETQEATQAQIEIEIGPDDDDDDYYYEYDEPPQVWIGPGLYYGVWFDDEYEYNRWYRRHYYRGYRRGGYHHDGDHHDDHHGGGHGGGGRHGH